MLSKIPHIQILRPQQWIKNIFVFVPLLFSIKYMDSSAILTSIIVFVGFCMTASCVYIINDLLDVADDKLHPIKAITRPLAAGTLSVYTAYCLLTVLLLFLLIYYLYDGPLFFILTLYLIINIIYSFYLKFIIVLDVVTISIGYLLRVYAGAISIEVPSSQWMLLATFFLAIYLSLVKREKEKLIVQSHNMRILNQYSAINLKNYTFLFAGATILSYAIFSITQNQLLTLPFFLLWFFRYWYITQNSDKGIDPSETFLADIPLLLITLGWVLIPLLGI